MKAKTKKTRWLLIALLVGFLAAAGLALSGHHGAPTVAKAKGATPPTHAVLAQPHANLVAAIGAKHAFWAPAGARPGDGPTEDTYSNSQAPLLTGHSGAPTNTPTAIAGGWSHVAAGSAAASNNGTQPPSNHPSATGHAPKDGAGEFAYNGYAPLDCELPAGCGGARGISTLAYQPSSTSGGMPGVHNSGTTTDNPNSGTPGQNTVPPSDPLRSPVASAPELDSATLAGALTLLLGSLAVLLSRRVRATR